jgi:hypothetical protein
MPKVSYGFGSDSVPCCINGYVRSDAFFTLGNSNGGLAAVITQLIAVFTTSNQVTIGHCFNTPHTMVLVVAQQ